MKAKNGPFNRNHARAWLLAGALCCVQVGPAAAAKLPQWGSSGASGTGKSYSISPGSGDLRVPIKSPGGGWQTAGNFGVQNPASGPTMTLGGEGKVVFRDVTNPGISYGYSYRGSIPLEAIGRAGLAAASCVTGGVVPALVCGGLAAGMPYLLDWVSKAGGRYDPATGHIERQGAGTDEYMINGDRIRAGSPSAACSAWHGLPATYAQSERGYPAGYTFEYMGYQAPSCIVYIFNVAHTPIISTPFGITKVAGTQQPGNWLPTSMDDIAPYMGLYNPDPRVVQEILSKGGDIPLPDTGTVTGPSSINGPETTTIKPDGTRVVEKTQYNFQTSGNTITNTTNITTTNTYNSGGTLTGTETKTVAPAPEASPKPEDPPTQCDKFPETLGCSQLDTPEGQIPKSTKEITYSEESRFGGGSCPANKSWSIQTTGTTVASAIDWQFICTSALPLRAMIMALAAFIALVIVMPGGGVKTD